MKQIDQKGREPVFVPGAGKRIGLWLIGIAIVLAVTILTYPVYLFSCTYITGSCL